MYLLRRLTYSSQIWHMYAMNCPASEYAIYKIMHDIDYCCLATEECEIMACVHAGIKRCHGKSLHNFSYFNLCINKVYEYILLNATTVIKGLLFYSTNKMKIDSIFRKFYTKIYPTHQLRSILEPGYQLSNESYDHFS